MVKLNSNYRCHGEFWDMNKKPFCSKNENTEIYDFLIVGGGPGGIAAAISAKRTSRNMRVAIIEKNSSIGKKLRATGNGKCNITNTNAPNYEQVIRFLHENGVGTKTLANGYVYPHSGSAADVVSLFEKRLFDLDVDIISNSEVIEISTTVIGESSNDYNVVNQGIREINNDSCKQDNKIFIATIKHGDSKRRIKGKLLLIATGGKSMPGYGSTGDIVKFARALGHTTSRLVPSLTPIECERKINILSGIRTSGEASLFKNGAKVHSESGEIQFTKYGLSGICIFNLSRKMKFDKGDSFKNFEIRLDLARDFDIENHLKNIKNDAKCLNINKTVLEAMCTVYKEELSKEILCQSGVDVNMQIVDLSDSSMQEIANVAGNLKFIPTGLKGWKDAQCTSGGIIRDEINFETQESKLTTGLYFAGEAIDYDGPCGGYNLNFAWFTGDLAGRSAAEREQKS